MYLQSVAHTPPRSTSEEWFTVMETEQILNRILIGCRTTKPKVIIAANQHKGKYHKQPIRIQSKKEQTTESAGKREYQVAVGFILI